MEGKKLHLITEEIRYVETTDLFQFSGISGEFAYHGHRVKMYDSCISALDTVYARMEEDKRDLRIEELLLHKNFIVRLKGL